jgi:RNA polymerase sigma-70 factor (ECF subfamily)
MDDRAAGAMRSVESVEAVFREERGRLLASLVRRFGDLDLAEDVASEVIEAALQHWPAEGVPAKPGAWLLTTARRRAVDRLRRDHAYAARLALMQAEADRAEPAPPADANGDLPDERLRLFFTCAHPALPVEDRGALTLRCLAGLTTPEVSRAFLVPSATMAQRIVRAKKKIRDARIPFRVPGADELPERLPGVLQVVYSSFTEGYVASAGPELQRLDLAEEAIRLARILRRLLPAVGQARNRVTKAVERTVPFGLFCYSLLILWYTLHGHPSTDVAHRRASAPWYRSKTEPATLDMLTSLRRQIIAARFLPTSPRPATTEEILEVQQAWALAA